MADQGGMSAYKFVMSFVSASDKFRQQFTDKWQEVVSNFIVDGAQIQNTGGETSPYSRSKVYRSPRNRIFLRDPETHKLVMTYAAKLARTIFGNKRGEFVQAQPVGYEDVAKSDVVTRLLRYDFNLPGHFRTFVEGLVDMILFGTSVIECYWRYEEREVIVRQAITDGATEFLSSSRMTVPVYDDVCIRNVDVMDFYPDPARYRIEEMSGCAKKFKMNGFEARRLADTGYYTKSGVSSAMGSSVKTVEMQEQSFRSGLDQPAQADPIPDFKEMVGYDYWGNIPEEADARDDETGERITRGVVTILNQQVVRARNWPLTDPRLPFFTLIINPVQGRFYGISPAEVVRFDQSFADAMKILLAEAIVRQVHPPIAYDSDAEFDVAKLREWRADLPIPVRGGPQAIGTLRYDANIQSGFALMTGLKQEIQGGSGAMGAIQGESGPDRESATGYQGRVQMALDRPELAGMVLESECMPPIAKAMLMRNQQFLEDTEDLKRRVGEIPAPFWIGDILGDFDIRFVGSRNAMSNQERLMSLQTLAQFGTAFPAFQAMMPNAQVAQMIVGDILNLPEAAAQIGDLQAMQQNVALTQMMSQAGGHGGPAQNGVATQPQPIAPMAQLAGGVS
jgi:hypothetical protein